MIAPPRRPLRARAGPKLPSKTTPLTDKRISPRVPVIAGGPRHPRFSDDEWVHIDIRQATPDDLEWAEIWTAELKIPRPTGEFNYVGTYKGESVCFTSLQKSMQQGKNRIFYCTQFVIPGKQNALLFLYFNVWMSVFYLYEGGVYVCRVHVSNHRMQKRLLDGGFKAVGPHTDLIYYERDYSEVPLWKFWGVPEGVARDLRRDGGLDENASIEQVLRKHGCLESLIRP